MAVLRTQSKEQGREGVMARTPLKCRKCGGLVGEEPYTKDVVCLNCGWRVVREVGYIQPTVEDSLPRGHVDGLDVFMVSAVLNTGPIMGGR